MRRSKFDNIHNIDETLLVSVRYTPIDGVQRLFKGGVTELPYGRWRVNEEGAVHVADAMLWVESGRFTPLNLEAYREAVRFLRSGGVHSPKAVTQKKPLNVEHIKWVGSSTAKLLAEHGITTVEHVANMTVDDLLQYTAKAPHITVDRANEIIEDAKKHL